MKRVLVVVFSVMILASLGSWAQTSSQKSDKNSTSTSGKTMTITGMVSNEGKMFVSDKDNKSWKVDNPDTLKAHDGHHVRLNASEDPASDTLHVNSVKMLGKAKSGTSSNGGIDNTGNKGGKY
jgi:membrane protein implicated in regulation of membrane protease activity